MPQDPNSQDSEELWDRAKALIDELNKEVKEFRDINPDSLVDIHVFKGWVAIKIATMESTIRDLAGRVEALEKRDR